MAQPATTIRMQAPASGSAVVMAAAMPSGTSYVATSGGFVDAKPSDVSALLGLGFIIYSVPPGRLISDTYHVLEDIDAFRTLWFESDGTQVEIPLGLMTDFQTLIVDGSDAGDLEIIVASPGPTVQGNLTSGGSFAVISIVAKPQTSDYYVVGGNTTA